MIKYFYTILIILNSFSIGFSQATNDSAFLYRHILKDSYHAIFIDNNRLSDNYNKIINGIGIDQRMYKEIIQQLKESGSILKKDFTINFESDWYSLHLYKNEFYAYAPSESYVNTWININDSCVVMNYFNDGCVPAFLNKLNWINNKTIEIKTHSLYKEETIIVIHFLNATKDLAVFEFPLRSPAYRFQLMASKNSLRKYPLIVNYCKENRVFEWDFDKPDFDKLLNAKKNIP